MRYVLQDVEVTGDKDDSRCLHINIHKPAASHLAKPIPLLTAKFIFDDHIRCMAAKQRLTKGRTKARQVCSTVSVAYSLICENYLYVLIVLILF